MDPLTAFSTAGTVLQVVDFGAKLIKSIFDYTQHGGSNEQACLEQYIQTPISRNAHLQSL